MHIVFPSKKNLSCISVPGVHVITQGVDSILGNQNIQTGYIDICTISIIFHLINFSIPISERQISSPVQRPKMETDINIFITGTVEGIRVELL